MNVTLPNCSLGSVQYCRARARNHVIDELHDKSRGRYLSDAVAPIFTTFFFFKTRSRRLLRDVHLIDETCAGALWCSDSCSQLA